MLESRNAQNLTDAARLIWDPNGSYSPSMRGWLREVGALGLATSTLFAVHDTSDRGGARPMVMVNPGICTSLGYQPRELLGQQLCQVFYGTGGVAGSEQALQTLHAGMVSGNNCLVKLKAMRKSQDVFSSICVLRHFFDEKSAPRFAITLQVELPDGQPVKQLVERLTKLMKLMPFGLVPRP